MKKGLNEISWNVTEEQYRQDPALSQSTLGKYEREGFDGLDHLFDSISTPALTQGSMVDDLITGGEEEFNQHFYVADFPTLGDKEQQIADMLFDRYHESCAGISAISKQNMINVINDVGYYNNYQDSTRIKKIVEKCSNYYNLKYLAGDKVIVNTDTYSKVLAMVNALKESPTTGKYFASDDPSDDIKRYYQLKFKSVFEGIEYRGMLDLVIVDYKRKIILPCDLKTTGAPEHNFRHSVLKWGYSHQARLYWRILRDNLDRDPYFKDFTLLDFRFIVVNKNSLTPLIWEFPLTKTYGTLIDDEGNEYKDPFEIGKELTHYLSEKPRVPDGIDINGVNIIDCLKLNEN